VDYEQIRYEVDGHVLTITLDRPERLNAATSQMIGELVDVFDRSDGDDAVRAVIVTGAGRGFCAGADLSSGGFSNVTSAREVEPVDGGGLVARRIFRSLKPVIAAVNGPAAGGGFALVLGSDVRIAARTARFNAAFIRIGISACDIGTSWLLPRLIGAARAQELMLTGRLFDADEAYRIGLVIDVLDDDTLLDAAYAKAAEIMTNSPFGVALTKEGMWSALEIPGLQAAIDLENRQQIMSSMTADHVEARKAFLERRPAHFVWG